MNQSTDVNISLYFESAKDLLLAVVNSKEWIIAKSSPLSVPNMDEHMQSVIQSLESCASEYALYKTNRTLVDGRSSQIHPR